MPAPKNLYANDICISSDVPVFATGKSPIKYIGRGQSGDVIENEMMDARWKFFKFHAQIAEADQKGWHPVQNVFPP